MYLLNYNCNLFHIFPISFHLYVIDLNFVVLRRTFLALRICFMSWIFRKKLANLEPKLSNLFVTFLFRNNKQFISLTNNKYSQTNEKHKYLLKSHFIRYVLRVYFARDYIYSTVPTNYFAYIPVNVFKFDVFIFELWI